jgi:HSP20 family protein
MNTEVVATRTSSNGGDCCVSGSAPAERTRGALTFCPAVDIVEHADELTVWADLPGADASSIDVLFENGTLTIHGHVPPRRSREAPMYLREYGVGDFHRSFAVGETIDSARLTAEFADGVLTLHLPKVEAAKPRKIVVQGPAQV